MKTFLRVLIIGAILIILVFLSIGIVRVVPKALSSLASATVSLGSIFGGSDSHTNSSGSNANQANTGNSSAGANTNSSNGGSVVTSNGFIISSSTSSSASAGASTSTSLTDIIKARFDSYGQNNYVPNPGTNTSSYNYSTGAYSNSSNSSSANTSSNASVYTASPCTSASSPDLAVEIISKGIIDRTTGQFVATNSFSTNDVVSIKFKVENRGVCPTGTWNIRVQMPSSNSADQLKELKGNASIPAGAALIGQANFDSPITNNPVFSVTVSDNSGRDANSSNNTSSASLNVVNTGTGGTGGGSTGIVLIGDGRADLAVRVLQVGTLGYNNVFIPQSNTSVFQPYNKLAVKFEVINQGKSASGLWTFRADISGASNQQYQDNQYEASIPSGGRSTFTMSFDPRIGSNYITIYADSLNQINEFDEGNNSATANFYVSY